MFVGTSSLACSWRMGITLLAFFGASSRLTQFREELKDVDESHRTGGQRDWQQVCKTTPLLILSSVLSQSLRPDLYANDSFQPCVMILYLHIYLTTAVMTTRPCLE